MAEETKKEEISARKNAITQKIEEWFKNPYNKTFFFILLGAVAIRLFYFFSFKNQPLWFDEADYMVQSKLTAFNFKWDVAWSPRKPILLAWMFVPFYKIGFTEVALRFILILFSIAGVWMTYYVSKEFFDEKIALISTALMSVFWVNLFFSIRFMVDMPATTLFLASLYFFVKGYVKKENPKYIWLFGVFFALGFLMRVSYGIFILPFLAYLLVDEKLAFFKNKHLWLAIIIAFLVVLPYFIWLFNMFPQDTLGKFIGAKYGRFSIGKEHGSMGFPGIIAYIKDFPNVLKMPYFILFLLGFVLVFMDLIVGIDLLFKKDYTHLRLKFFILLWIILTIFAMGLTRSYVEQRDTMIYSFFMFSIIGVALVQIYNFIATKLTYKYAKILAIIAVITLIIWGAIPHLTYGYQLTKDKSISYQAVRDAGLWIKEHSNINDAVSTKSIPQIKYYSERPTYDIIGVTEEEFIGNLSQKKIRFFVPSTFEPYWLVPQWSYTWGQMHPEFATLVWWWADNPQQPREFLIVYEINLTALEQNKTEIINEIA